MNDSTALEFIKISGPLDYPFEELTSLARSIVYIFSMLFSFSFAHKIQAPPAPTHSVHIFIFVFFSFIPINNVCANNKIVQRKCMVSYQ